MNLYTRREKAIMYPLLASSTVLGFIAIMFINTNWAATVVSGVGALIISFAALYVDRDLMERRMWK